MKLSKKTLGKFKRALESTEGIYYVDFNEGDENASVKMYNRKRELLSDNIHAYNSLFEALELGRYSWISGDMQINWNLYKENLDSSNEI